MLLSGQLQQFHWTISKSFLSVQLLWVENLLLLLKRAQGRAWKCTRQLGTFVRCSRERRSRFNCVFFPPPAATVIPCFHCLDSSFVGLVLLVWLCSHCLMHKLAEEPEPDKHAAHTSVQICGIFPRCKQLTASNEHMLLLLQLCHHNYWPKSVPPHRPHHSFPHEKQR